MISGDKPGRLNESLGFPGKEPPLKSAGRFCLRQAREE
jgi:hypothetical protein